ncbi:MAG: rplY [Acidimicrobiales bacterium]|jgi:large subunit ribosomal protein L25|nr:rplY [Acidimicrobiales bacterium]
MPSEVVLTAESPRPTGSAAARRLRRAGKIPGVLYGHDTDPVALAVEGRDLRHALSGDAGLNALINLDVKGTKHLAMARYLQRDPVRGTVSHVDFLIVRRDEVISAEVPVHLVGEAEDVHRNDGLVEQQLFTLTVQAKPADIPHSIEVDVSRLTIGHTIRVADLALPAGATTDVDAEEPVVAGMASRLAAEVEAADEAAAEAVAEAVPEGEEAAAPAEGEAPAEAASEGGGSSESGGE